MILTIVKLPTPSLRERSLEVTKAFLAKTETKKFINDLIETMYDDDGIGIASAQVAENIRLCVIAKGAVPGKKKDLILVNPEMERTSKKTTSDTEGCLSVPNVYGKVKRYKDLRVTALDEYGTPMEFEAKNFFARVIQHELDHLNGTLFVDKATDIYEVQPGDVNYKYGQGKKGRPARDAV